MYKAQPAQTKKISKGDRVKKSQGYAVTGTVLDTDFCEIWRCNKALVKWDFSISQSWTKETAIAKL